MIEKKKKKKNGALGADELMKRGFLFGTEIGHSVRGGGGEAKKIGGKSKRGKQMKKSVYQKGGQFPIWRSRPGSAAAVLISGGGRYTNFKGTA